MWEFTGIPPVLWYKFFVNANNSLFKKKKFTHLRQPCKDQFYWCHFSSSIWSLPIFVLHFDNSHNISNIFIISNTCSRYL